MRVILKKLTNKPLHKFFELDSHTLQIFQHLQRAQHGIALEPDSE